MNKLITAVFAAMFLAGAVNAQHIGPKHNAAQAPTPQADMKADMHHKKAEMREEMKERRTQMQKQQTEINVLVEKYNKEKKAKKKAEIEAQIKTKVAEGYDKRLGAMQERIDKTKQGLAKAEEKLAKASVPEEKEKAINEITKKIIAGEMPKYHKKGDKDKRDMRHKKNKGEMTAMPMLMEEVEK